MGSGESIFATLRDTCALAYARQHWLGGHCDKRMILHNSHIQL
jgi:hypothetical protein